MSQETRVDGMTIRIQGTYSCIGDIEWSNVPRLAMLTGLNGVGKTQLLEVIASSLDSLSLTPWKRVPPKIDAKATFIGDTFARGEVFHSYGEWAPLSSVAASEDDIKIAIQKLQADRRHAELERALSSDLQLEAATIRNMTPPQFVRKVTPGILWTYSAEEFRSLSFLFLAYRYCERIGFESGEEPEQIAARLGEPPWELLSAIISAAGLPFAINYPSPLEPSMYGVNQAFEFKLYDSEENVVPLDRLSSGERVLMSTCMWRYQAEVAGEHFRFLLLDEPDAHLHPSLTWRFLNVLNTVFVEQRGVRVIMTTHSPSTVALAAEGSLFEMRRSHPRIRAISRSEAIANLTGGFVAVQDATRTVFVEGKSDPPFYRLIWQLLIERPVRGGNGVLEPYPNINFVRGQGRQTVQELVPQLRGAGFTNFFGIIDRDKGNSPRDGVYVLGRCAIESYIYDPLIIWFHAKKKRFTFSIDATDARLTTQARDLSEMQLQSIVDNVVAYVERQYPPTSSAELERVYVDYGNAVLSYPLWCHTRNKGDIKTQYARVFGQFPQDDLLATYREVDMVPRDLAQLFAAIQIEGATNREYD